jgi:hypothetical protein
MPGMHCVTLESKALVHVTGPSENGTGVHVMQDCVLHATV